MDKQDLRKVGLKVTSPRTKVLEILESSQNHHLSAEDIFKALMDRGDEIGLATVYRVLMQFEQAGLVIRHNFEGGYSVYEIDQGEHHDHLVCVKCGRVEEFFDESIEARQEAIAKEMGFDITDHSLNIYGICKECQD